MSSGGTNRNPGTPLLITSSCLTKGMDRHRSRLNRYKVALGEMSGGKLEPSVPLMSLHSPSFFQKSSFDFWLKEVTRPMSLKCSLMPVFAVMIPGLVPFLPTNIPNLSCGKRRSGLLANIPSAISSKGFSLPHKIPDTLILTNWVCLWDFSAEGVVRIIMSFSVESTKGFRFINANDV